MWVQKARTCLWARLAKPSHYYSAEKSGHSVFHLLEDIGFSRMINSLWGIQTLQAVPLPPTPLKVQFQRSSFASGEEDTGPWKVEGWDNCVYENVGKRTSATEPFLFPGSHPLTAADSITNTMPFTGQQSSANWLLRLSYPSSVWAEALWRTAPSAFAGKQGLWSVPAASQYSSLLSPWAPPRNLLLLLLLK